MRFNQIFNFFFINSKINTFLFLDSIALANLYFDLCDEGAKAQTIYNKQIRRYLGLGFFLSFIPGTEPFKARKNLLSVITNIEAQIDASNDPTMSFLLATPFSIFTRLGAGLLHLFETDPRDFFTGKTKLNRLNPFLYIAGIIVLIFGLLALGVSLLFRRFFPDFDIDTISPYIFIPLAVVIGGIFSTACFIYAISYLLTELILNTLSALFIDPIIFVFEAIHQLFADWSVEFVQAPTEDYRKINRLLASLGEEILYDAHLTKELTLIEAPKDKISRFEKHHDSIFYTLYKNTALFSALENEKIVRSHNFVEHLFQFRFFSKATKALNKDVLDYTVQIGLESDIAEIEYKK